MRPCMSPFSVSATARSNHGPASSYPPTLHRQMPTRCRLLPRLAWSMRPCTSLSPPPRQRARTTAALPRTGPCSPASRPPDAGCCPASRGRCAHARPFLRLRDSALEPPPRFLEPAPLRDALPILMQAAAQARVVDAPVHVPFLLLRDSA